LDIKVISGIVGVVFTFGALFVQVGEVLNRLSALEGKSAPDTTIIEQDVNTLKSEVAVLKTKIEEMKAKNSNPLMR
jgi:hypothetical protein